MTPCHGGSLCGRSCALGSRRLQSGGKRKIAPALVAVPPVRLFAEAGQKGIEVTSQLPDLRLQYGELASKAFDTFVISRGCILGRRLVAGPIIRIVECAFHRAAWFC